MRRERGTPAASLCVLAVWLLSPVRADDRVVPQQLESYYRRFSKAAMERTSDGLQQLVRQNTTPDFVRKTPYGTESRQTYLMGFKVHWVTPPAQAEERLDKLKVQGNQAVAMVTDTTTRTLPADDQTRRVHTLRGLVIFQDTWTKTAAGWRLKQREMVGQAGFRDGKQIFRYPPWPTQ
jgi:hypothetical protein